MLSLKILTTICIFCFVNGTSDLNIYCMILSLGTLVGNILLWTKGFKYFNVRLLSFKNITIHIKPIIHLFIPTIAISVYQYMDKIMLGNMASMDSVGFYENAEKLISVPLSIVTAFGIVMYSHACKLYSESPEKIEKSINSTIYLISLIVIPMSLGLFAVANEFVPWYYGEGFEPCIILIKIFSIELIFRALANVIRTQYLLPHHKDNLYVISVVSGAFINLALNVILIYKYDCYGAAIATVLTEFVVFMIQLGATLKNINLSKSLYSCIPIFLFSIIMLCVVGFSKKIIRLDGFLKLIAEIGVGVISFGILYALYFLLKKLTMRWKNEKNNY